MATVHLNEVNLDVVLEEISFNVDIQIDVLNIDICEYSTSTTRCPDALDVIIEESQFSVDIVEEVL